MDRQDIGGLAFGMRLGLIALSFLLLMTVSARAESVCTYRLDVRDVSVSWIDVTVMCPAERPLLFRGWRSIPHDHVRSPKGLKGSVVAKVERGWRATPVGGAVHFRYGFDVADLTRSTGNPDIARWVGKSLITSVSSFLLAPDLPDGQLDLEFRLPEGLSMATGLARRKAVHRIAVRDVAYAGYMVFGQFRRLTFDLPAAPRAAKEPPKRARVTVAILDAAFDMKLSDVRAWFDVALPAVGGFFGGFPVDRSLVVMWPRPGRSGLLRGVVVGGGGATMLLQVGQHARRARVEKEWMLIHELVHFGFPHVADRRRWLSEGTAVYGETVIRARAGLISRDETWFDLIGFFQSGLPALEKGGLDKARSIDGIYAGGALFMMLADIEIRRATQGRATLETCLRGVLAAGGDVTQRWTSARIIATCDEATGVPALASLAAKYAAKGTPLNYPALWSSLGIRKVGRRVAFDDKAPLAAIRRAILAPR